MTFLAIDPSIRSIGWATFFGNPHMISNSLQDWEYGVFKPDPEHIYDSIRYFIRSKRFLSRVDKLILELPNFQNSEKGRIAAKQGYTTQLGIVVGYIMGLIDLTQEDVFLYPPIVWKGTVPKEVTLAKLKRDFKNSNRILDSLNHDTIDAIGLLRFHLVTEFQWA